MKGIFALFNRLWTKETSANQEETLARPTSHLVCTACNVYKLLIFYHCFLEIFSYIQNGVKTYCIRDNFNAAKS